MCTGIKIQSKNNQFYWGRTQEFNMELPYQGIVIPRNFHTSMLLTNGMTKHAVLGVGMEGSELVIDGVNECGLVGGSFYFADQFNYSTEDDIKEEGKISIRGEEALTWFLTNCATIDEVIEAAEHQILIANTPNMLGIVLPQHFVFQDASGRSIVVEPSKKLGFSIFENKIGAFTNSPGFDWHLQNLRNYTNLNNTPSTDLEWKNEIIKGIGRGTNLKGLPGDFTSVSRFIRAAFIRNYTDNPTDEQAIKQLFHMLSTFDIPKGLLKDDQDSNHYTQYTSAYDQQQLTLFYHNYDNRAIQKLQMDEALMVGKEIARFNVSNNEVITEMEQA